MLRGARCALLGLLTCDSVIVPIASPQDYQHCLSSFTILLVHSAEDRPDSDPFDDSLTKCKYLLLQVYLANLLKELSQFCPVWRWTCRIVYQKNRGNHTSATCASIWIKLGVRICSVVKAVYNTSPHMLTHKSPGNCIHLHFSIQFSCGFYGVGPRNAKNAVRVTRSLSRQSCVKEFNGCSQTRDQISRLAKPEFN